MLDQITPLILTLNEEANLARALEQLRWARRVVVLDSGSDDSTRAIAQGFANVSVYTRAFDTHAAQWNHGLTACGIDTPWVLALDADYVLPADECARELSALQPEPAVSGYRAHFRYCIHGRALRGSLYPPVTVLFRRAQAQYVQDGHTQRLQLAGEVRTLAGRIDHDDRKPLQRWLSSQARYARLEADLLLRSCWSDLRIQDRLRLLLVVTPWLVPMYTLCVQRGLFDGWAGVHYALQRGLAESILSLTLIETRYFGKRD